MTTDTKTTIASRILPDVLAFVLGLGVAYFGRWETRDLVWSLWLCSLVLGYLTLLSALAAGAYVGLHVVRRLTPGKPRFILVLIGGGAGAFFLVFFSFHFCGFHAGHSVFLNHFFPVAGLPSDGLGSAFMNPPRLWALVFRHLMHPYGLFVVPAIIAERQYVLRPLTEALRAIRSMADGRDESELRAAAKPAKRGGSLSDAMARPYINVVRMHLLIFFFAISHALKLDSFVVYAVVYAVYFFPWSQIRKKRE